LVSGGSLEHYLHRLVDFRNLPKDIRTRPNKALRLLIENPRHPSPRAKKMKAVEDIGEASISMAHRVTYQIAGDDLILRRIGTHDILREETR